MKRRLCSPLSRPQIKRRPGHDLAVSGCPLPVPVASLTGVPASNCLWSVYHGRRVTSEAGRHRVEISDPDQARAVYNNGYFGDLVVKGRTEDKARPVLESWSPSLDRDNLRLSHVLKQRNHQVGVMLKPARIKLIYILRRPAST